MTGTTESLPMDVAKDAGWQQQQQQQQQQEQDQKKGLDRNSLVRARLLTISQGAPVGEALPLESLDDLKGSPQPNQQPNQQPSDEDEFRRKLMSISYVDVPMPAQ